MKSDLSFSFSNQVPDDTIVSSKSGTPIKLLGHDDVGVNWYNLEKSKRVKAFRCGEYDACIETAKATASVHQGDLFFRTKKKDIEEPASEEIAAKSDSVAAPVTIEEPASEEIA